MNKTNPNVLVRRFFWFVAGVLLLLSVITDVFGVNYGRLIAGGQQDTEGDCAGKSLPETEYDVLRRFGPDETGTVQLDARNASVEVMEPLGIETVIALTARVEDGVSDDITEHDRMPGVEILLVNSTSPFLEDDSGNCEVNRIQLGESGPEVNLKLASRRESSHCLIRGRRYDPPVSGSVWFTADGTREGQTTTVPLRSSGLYFCFDGPILAETSRLHPVVSGFVEEVARSSESVLHVEGGQGRDPLLLAAVVAGGLAILAILLFFAFIVVYWLVNHRFLKPLVQGWDPDEDLDKKYIRNVSGLWNYNFSLFWLWLWRKVGGKTFYANARDAFNRSRGEFDDDYLHQQMGEGGRQSLGGTNLVLMGMRLHEERLLLRLGGDEWMVAARADIRRFSIKGDHWVEGLLLILILWVAVGSLFTFSEHSPSFPLFALGAFFATINLIGGTSARRITLRFRDGFLVRIRLPETDLFALTSWIQGKEAYAQMISDLEVAQSLPPALSEGDESRHSEEHLADRDEDPLETGYETEQGTISCEVAGGQPGLTEEERSPMVGEGASASLGSDGGLVEVVVDWGEGPLWQGENLLLGSRQCEGAEELVQWLGEGTEEDVVVEEAPSKDESRGLENGKSPGAGSQDSVDGPLGTTSEGADRLGSAEVTKKEEDGVQAADPKVVSLEPAYYFLKDAKHMKRSETVRALRWMAELGGMYDRP